MSPPTPLGSQPAKAPGRVFTLPVIHGSDDSNRLDVVQYWRSNLTDDSAANPSYGARVLCQLFRQDKIWLHLLYSNLGKKIQPNAAHGAIWVINTQDGTTEVISLPDGGVISQDSFGTTAAPTFEVFGDHLFLASTDAVRRYNLKTKVWDVLPLTFQGPTHIHLINDRLYVTTSDSILELTDNQTEARIVASRRRRPPVGLLDKVDASNLPPLFPGPGGSLRAFIAGRLYTWSGTVWSETFALHLGSVPSVVESGVCFTLHPAFHNGSVLFLGNSFDAPECVVSPIAPVFDLGLGVGRPVPTWSIPSNLNMADYAASGHGSNFLFYTDTAEPPKATGFSTPLNFAGAPEAPSPSLPVSNFTNRRPRILLFDRQFSSPFSIGLKFDQSKGRIPNPAKDTGENLFKPWLLTTPSGLVIGDWATDDLWFLPWAVLDTELNRRRIGPQAEKLALEANRLSIQKRLLSAFDRNGNGVFEPAEREAMISDPGFLWLNWQAIDTNNNGVIDPIEIKFFDADGDGKASDREVDAIQLAETFLADDLMTEFDRNKDGHLDAAEILELAAWRASNQSPPPPAFSIVARFKPFDRNRDDQLDRAELKEMLTVETLGRLRPTQSDAENRASYKSVMADIWAHAGKSTQAAIPVTKPVLKVE